MNNISINAKFYFKVVSHMNFNVSTKIVFPHTIDVMDVMTVVTTVMRVDAQDNQVGSKCLNVDA